MDWIKETEKIAQVTRLPIVCLRAEANRASQLEAERGRDGWEVVCADRQGELVSLVMIQSRHWPPSARAMLQLYFPQRQSASLSGHLSAWLGGIMQDGLLAPAPPRLDQLWPWREERVCFLLQRCRPESAFSWEELGPLLDTFFARDEPARLSIPLGHDDLLLVVPLSQLGHQHEPEDLLEWAFGLHDMIACEMMEHLRLLVARPIDTPAQIGKSLVELRQLSAAIQRYRPKTMVAGSWLHALERWAASLEEKTASELGAMLNQTLSAASLSEEQVETLETLFAHQLNVSEAARHLFLHRNTLLYRLDKLTEQTGLDPRHFRDAVLLQLSLLFRHN